MFLQRHRAIPRFVAPARTHVGRFAVTLAGLVLLAGCRGDGRTPPAPAVHPSGHEMFLHHVVDRAPPGGAECCTDVASLADFNGDGLLDVLIGSENDRKAGLVWYEYPTWRRHPIAKGGFTTDGHAVDFDGDGDTDVVVGDIETGVTWFEWRAEPRVWKRHLLADGYVHDLRIADLTGDGRLDVLSTDKHKLEVLESRADGAQPIRRVILERKGEGLDVADLDGDGDKDILFSNVWLEKTGPDLQRDWTVRELAPSWPVDTRIQVVDVNSDGRLDVVLSASEGEGKLAWFEADGLGAWVEHPVSSEALVGAHSLRVADFDLDGDVDILVAEMHSSPRKRVLVYLNEQGAWRELPLAQHGSHNMVVGDVDGDGDVDLVGKNYEGRGRFLEYWENRSADLQFVPSKVVEPGPARWRYDPIDTERPVYDAEKFALMTADLDGDGDADVVAGGTVYVNQRGHAGPPWEKVSVLPEADIIFATNTWINGWRTLLAVGLDSLWEVSASDQSGRAWQRRWLARLPEGRTQGWTSGPAGDDGSQTLYFTHATTLYSLRTPSRPGGAWRLKPIRQRIQEEAVAVGDIDGDGDEDLVLVDGSGRNILWLEGERGRFLRAHKLGASLRWLDRLALQDVNRDGRIDILFTEETGNADYNARVGWLQAPARPAEERWRSHTIVVLRSANSLGIGDVDQDGYPDVIVAEHTDFRPDVVALDNFTGVFLNRGGDRWDSEIIDIGPRSSHLGAKTADLNGDGILEVLSVGYGQSCCVHRWLRTPERGDQPGDELGQQ